MGEPDGTPSDISSRSDASTSRSAPARPKHPRRTNSHEGRHEAPPSLLPLSANRLIMTQSRGLPREVQVIEVTPHDTAFGERVLALDRCSSCAGDGPSQPGM